MTLAILKITDGTTTIDLLNKDSGFLLSEWTPAIADFKDGGIFQNSPLATGRRLVAYRYANTIETMQLKAHHVTPDALIRDTQELRRLLQKAADYWATDWQNTPVYIAARANGETNTRYCIIHTGRFANDANPYAQPFMQPMCGAAMDSIPFIFERGHWLENAPGTVDEVTLSGESKWTTPEWNVLTTTPSGEVLAILQTTHAANNGLILAGTDDSAKIYGSTDNGVTWTLLDTISATATDQVNVFLETSNGYLFAGVSGSSAANGVWRSTDGGATWTQPSTTPQDTYALIETEFVQKIQAFGELSTPAGFRYISGNYAVSWSGLSDASHAAYLGGVEIPSTGEIFFIHDDIIANTSGAVVTHGSSTFECLIRLTNGRLLAGMANGVMYRSDDDGANWATVTTTITGGCYSITEGIDGTIYAGGSSRIWRSWTDGETWIQVNSDPTINVEGIAALITGEIYVGDDGQILEQPYQENSATIQHVINGHPIGSISNIKQYNDSTATYSDPFPNSTLPYDIYASDGVGVGSADYVYFGIRTEAGSFPFSTLVFNIITAGTSPLSGETWEYWDGSTWSTLDVVENTRGPISLFSKTGQWSITWEIPSDWATTSVDSVTAYWVRTGSGIYNASISDVIPEQGEYDIYAMQNAFVEISATGVLGDLPALAKIEIDVASDYGGPGGSSPTGYINRAIIGLRSYSRGSRFNAYINASDQGNDPSITVDAGTDTTFADDITYPTARRATFSPTTTGSWVTVLTFSIANDLVQEYYGTYHAFLRCRQSGGSAGDIDLRLRTSTGSGGVQIDTVSKTLANTNANQFIDFGRLTIPVSSLLNTGEAGDEAQLIIQCNASSTTPDIYFMDLVLIPTDEWLGDFTDKQNSATSPLTDGYYLDVDSATFPKRSVRAMVRNDATDAIKNVYQPVVNGEAILQANARQRLWFFFARTASSGSTDWRSEPTMAAKITLSATQRYLGMRGAR